MNLNLLLKAAEPWIVSYCGTYADLLEAVVQLEADDPGLYVAALDGQRMTSLDEMYDEFIAELRLPDYFGRNYDALDECLSDLDWMDFDAIVLLIDHAESVLSSEPAQRYTGLLDILWDAGAEWSSSAKPFHVVLVENDGTATIRSGFQHEIPALSI